MACQASKSQTLLLFLCHKPWLNSVENVWWLLKAAGAADRLYGLIDTLIGAMIAFLNNLTGVSHSIDRPRSPLPEILIVIVEDGKYRNEIRNVLTALCVR